MELIVAEWARLEPTLPIFDKSARFEEWSEEAYMGSTHYAGMRHLGKLTGIVRKYGKDYVTIDSWKADLRHGLQIDFLTK